MKPVPDAIYISVRAAIDLAIADESWIRLVLRPNPDRPGPERVVEGAPYEVVTGPDGRERVFVRIAEATEQIVFVERIARVLSGL